MAKISKAAIRYQISLVHNNSPLRNPYIIPRLEFLGDLLQAPFHAISWQPIVTPHTLWHAFFREWDYFRLLVRWSRYRSLQRINWRLTSIGFVLHVARKYAFSAKARKRWQRFSFIETIVTAKHIRTWEVFVESDAECLMCFEDDVIFLDETNERLSEVLNWVQEIDANQPMYVDLAGGLDWPVLELGRLIHAHERHGIIYSKPVTNTACGYIINRAMAELFLSILIEKPKLRSIGIDWMMNALFMELQDRDVTCTCLHASPSVFGHGTFTGKYESWQQTPN